MNFFEYLDHSRQLIKGEISLFIRNKQKEELPKVFKEQRLLELLESFVGRGKFVRGTLFLLMIEALGKKINKEHIRIACAIELMHSSLLIQDDIIDNDEMRRGAKTIFAHYRDEGKNIGAHDPYHYGISTAIVLSDIAFFFAQEMLSDFEDLSLGKLLRYFSHEVYLVILAESGDSIFGQTDREPTKEEIYAVYKYKTARYTFSLPFEMASIVCGVPITTRELLNSFGENSGLIFQLKDDELGLFGDEETIGKPIGGDIRENKKTLIRYFLYSLADQEDLLKLDGIFGNPQSGDDEIKVVKKIYDKLEIQEKVDEEVGRIMNKVWDIFSQLDIKKSYKSILKELLEYNLSRKK